MLLICKKYLWLFLYKTQLKLSTEYKNVIYIIILINEVLNTLQNISITYLSKINPSLIIHKHLNKEYNTIKINQIKYMGYKGILILLSFFLFSGFNFNSLTTLKIVDSIGYIPNSVVLSQNKIDSLYSLPLTQLNKLALISYENRGRVKYIIDRPHLVLMESNKPSNMSCSNNSDSSYSIYDSKVFKARIINVRDNKYQVNQTLINSLVNKDEDIYTTEKYKYKNITELATIGKYQVLGRYIKTHESFSPERYYCIGNYPTIGYGHVIRKEERSQYWDYTMTKEEAVTLLFKDIKEIESYLQDMIGLDTMYFTKQIALTHLCYNIGVGNFKKSTLYKNIVNNNKVTRDNFLSWSNVKGKRIKFIERMRDWEYEIYIKEESRYKNEVRDTLDYLDIKSIYIQEAKYNIITKQDSSLWNSI